MKLNNKGFTIIETLVAIAILMIAIAGPLAASQKSLMASLNAKNQIIGSFLAQDAMEYLKNKRDSYVQTSSFGNWLSTYSVCTSSSPCSVDTYTDSFNSCTSPCAIYDRGDRYTPSSTGGSKKTIFNRKFYIDTSSSATSNSSKEVKVVVVVDWQDSNIASDVKLENQFYNIQR